MFDTENIPQRMGIGDRNKRNYNYWAERLVFFLNGEKITHAVEYNIPAGWIDHYIVDDDDNFVLEGEGEDKHLKVKRSYGEVEARIRPEKQ